MFNWIKKLLNNDELKPYCYELYKSFLNEEPYAKVYLYTYKQLLDHLIKILDFLYLDLDTKGLFISIDEKFERHYDNLIFLMRYIEKSEILKSGYFTYIFSEVREFYELSLNSDEQVYVWKAVRDNYLKERDEIELICEQNRMDYKIDSEIILLFKNLEEDIKRHTEKMDLLRGRKPEIFAEIFYQSMTGKIILKYDNKSFLLAKTQLDKSPDVLFRYVFEHQNVYIKMADIPELKDQDLSKLVSKLNFKGIIKDVFMRNAKDTILFKSSISQKEFYDSGFDKEAFDKTIADLKEYKV